MNLHFSLLPAWRGAAPVQHAILAGDEVTGATTFRLEEGLDTGPVYECVPIDIASEETAEELRGRLVEVGTELLVRRLRDGLGEPRPQEGEPTYAAKLEPEEHHLDWARPAPELHRVVRLGHAWTTFRGRRLRVRRARLAPDASALEAGELAGVLVGTGNGALELTEVQPEGKAPQPASAWRHGARPQPGERLGA